MRESVHSIHSIAVCLNSHKSNLLNDFMSKIRLNKIWIANVQKSTHRFVDLCWVIDGVRIVICRLTSHKYNWHLCITHIYLKCKTSNIQRIVSSFFFIVRTLQSWILWNFVIFIHLKIFNWRYNLFEFTNRNGQIKTSFKRQWWHIKRWKSRNYGWCRCCSIMGTAWFILH